MTMSTARQTPAHPTFPQRASSMAVASLCVALGGGLAMFSHLVYLGLVAETTALVFGCVALGNIRHDRRLFGRGMAWTGIVIAALFLLVSVMLWVQIVTGWA